MHSIAKSIEDRIEENIIRIPFSECWYWRLAPGSHGYGQMMFTDHKPRLAHRLVYEKYVGPIPEGAHVLHRCDNRECCNPSHLFLGTQKDNMQDCKNKGRNSPPPIGQNFKIFASDRAEIARLYRLGKKAKHIAKVFGVDVSRVYQINREVTA